MKVIILISVLFIPLNVFGGVIRDGGDKPIPAGWNCKSKDPKHGIKVKLSIGEKYLTFSDNKKSKIKFTKFNDFIRTVHSGPENTKNLGLTRTLYGKKDKNRFALSKYLEKGYRSVTSSTWIFPARISIKTSGTTYIAILLDCTHNFPAMNRDLVEVESFFK